MMAESSADLVLETRHRHRAEIRGVIALAIPMVITTGSRAVMDMVDYVLITFLGSGAAQAAIIPAQLIMWSSIVVGMGVAITANTFASQALGRKQYRECSAYAWQTLYLAAAFGVATLALRPMLPWLIDTIGHEPGVQAMELAYARVAILTVGPTIAAAGLAAFFTGIHRPWIAVWSVLEANVVNLLVSVVLMFGYLGFEPLGIAGAAWGTLTAVCYRTLRLTIALVAPSLARSYGSRTTWRPSGARLKNLLRVGLPTGLQWLSEAVVWGLFVSVLVGRQFGTADLIATNTAWQYMRLAFVPAMGVSHALTALVGKSIGAGDRGRAMRETRIAVRLTVGYMGSLSFIYAWWGPELIELFNADPKVVLIGARIMICAAVFQLFDALTIAYIGALRGAGDTFVPAMFFVAVNWLGIIGGGWLIATQYPQLGSLGPWLAGSGVLSVTGLFLWWRWRRGAWRKIDIFRSHTLDAPPVETTADQPATVGASNQ